MSREHAITLTPAEIALHREGRLLWLVRALTPLELTLVAFGRVVGGTDEIICFCQPGDVLFHHEEWFDNCTSIEDQVIGAPRIYYRADDPEHDQFEGETPAWQPPDTMPSWASRYRLPVDSVELIREESAVPAPGGDMGDLVVERWAWKVGVAQGEEK